MKATKFIHLSMTVLLLALGTPAWAAFGNHDLKGPYSVRLTPAVSFSAFNNDQTEDATGSGLATAPRQDILRVGVIVFSGNGNLTARFVATTDTNTGDTQVLTFNVSGTYEVSTDGTGTLQFAPITTVTDHNGDTVEGTEDYSFVINQRTHTVDLIQTDNVGGGAKVFLTGQAVKNASKGGNTP